MYNLIDLHFLVGRIGEKDFEKRGVAASEIPDAAKGSYEETFSILEITIYIASIWYRKRPLSTAT